MKKGIIAVSLSLGFATSAPAITILIDFGRTDLQTAGNWNNVLRNTTVLNSIMDSDGSTVTGVTLTVTDLFYDIGEPSQGGSEIPSGDAAGFPVSATDDYLFGHTGAFGGSADNSVSQFKLSNLDPDTYYTFTFFGSRTATDNRETRYTVAGLGSGTALLNVSSNDTEVARVSLVRPDGSNEILIDVQAGPNNDNGNFFYYLGAVQIDTRPVPEPTGLAFLAFAGLLGSLRRARR